MTGLPQAAIGIVPDGAFASRRRSVWPATPVFWPGALKSLSATVNAFIRVPAMRTESVAWASLDDASVKNKTELNRRQPDAKCQAAQTSGLHVRSIVTVWAY